ncbi:MAG: hemerythrin domain-containing protein [Bryobacteraceae bacterium]|nr:hemerythrin domain-containing protein [Bryobacteraceae bacterium]
MIHADLLTAKGPAESATLDRPLDHLVACHRRIEDKLCVLERASAHMEDRTGEALHACHSAFAFLDSSGVLHTEDEEKSVFPRIRLHATSEEQAYLDGLEAQHREVEACFTRLKSLTGQLERDPSAAPAREAFAQGVAKLAGLYRAHIASENEVLTAIGRERLDEVALAEIAFEMRQRRSH